MIFGYIIVKPFFDFIHFLARFDFVVGSPVNCNSPFEVDCALLKLCVCKQEVRMISVVRIRVKVFMGFGCNCFCKQMYRMEKGRVNGFPTPDFQDWTYSLFRNEKP